MYIVYFCCRNKDDLEPYIQRNITGSQITKDIEQC